MSKGTLFTYPVSAQTDADDVTLNALISGCEATFKMIVNSYKRNCKRRMKLSSEGVVSSQLPRVTQNQIASSVKSLRASNSQVAMVPDVILSTVVTDASTTYWLLHSPYNGKGITDNRISLSEIGSLVVPVNYYHVDTVDKKLTITLPLSQPMILNINADEIPWNPTTSTHCIIDRVPESGELTVSFLVKINHKKNKGVGLYTEDDVIFISVGTNPLLKLSNNEDVYLPQQLIDDGYDTVVKHNETFKRRNTTEAVAAFINDQCRDLVEKYKVIVIEGTGHDRILKWYAKENIQCRDIEMTNLDYLRATLSAYCDSKSVTYKMTNTRATHTTCPHCFKKKQGSYREEEWTCSLCKSKLNGRKAVLEIMLSKEKDKLISGATYNKIVSKLK